MAICVPFGLRGWEPVEGWLGVGGVWEVIRGCYAEQTQAQEG
jgi:hypothetical protein